MFIDIDKVLILHLHLKGEYFDAIRSGSKTEEYRLVTAYWSKRLSQSFDEIRLYRGYPEHTETDKILKRKFTGVIIKKIVHCHFGETPVEAYVIDVSVPVMDSPGICSYVFDMSESYHPSTLPKTGGASI